MCAHEQSYYIAHYVKRKEEGKKKKKRNEQTPTIIDNSVEGLEKIYMYMCTHSQPLQNIHNNLSLSGLKNRLSLFGLKNRLHVNVHIR